MGGEAAAAAVAAALGGLSSQLTLLLTRATMGHGEAVATEATGHLHGPRARPL